MPPTWAAFTFNVAPTVSVEVPQVRVPVGVGLLWNTFTVMVLAPELIV